MKRSEFIRNSLLTAGAITTGAGLTNTFAAEKTNDILSDKTFNLDYAPHQGMFQNHAGKSFLDQIQFMFDKGFRIQTGPQLGILAAANIKQGDTKTDVKSSFKTAELGWTIGASYVGESGLGIDGRYNHGITRINDGGSTDLYNRGFQVGLFYVFRHKY